MRILKLCRCLLRKIQTRKGAVLFLCVTLCLLIHHFNRTEVILQLSQDSYNAPCVLPRIDPFDPNMIAMMHKVKPFECDLTPEVAFIDDENLLQFNTTAADIQGLNLDSITCMCSEIIRHRKDDDHVDWSEGVACKAGTKMKSDFFHIQCEVNGKPIMKSILTNIYRLTNKSYKTHGPDKYNVILFGIDSNSRSNAMRLLPKTFKYLTKDLQGIDMKGFMKVGDNTLPNLVALLTGRVAFTSELPMKDYSKEYYDIFPFIWNNYSQQGYVTLFAEDFPSLAEFNLHKRGFDMQPTDHYLRPFWLGWNKLYPVRYWANEINSVLESNYFKQMKSYSDSKIMCTGNIPNHIAHINYLKQFMKTYRKERKFAFSFLTELCHHDCNRLALADSDIVDFLQWMSHEGFLSNTIFIMFSDHGTRNANHFHAARMENSLPHLAIVLPEVLKTVYRDAASRMTVNTDRLITHFDMYATLSDILNSRFDNPSSITIGGKTRGISLFGEIPKQRSCAEALIPEHYCVCYKSTEVNITNNIIIGDIAKAVIDKLNAIMNHEPKCAQLSLSKIIEARMQSDGLKYDVFKKQHFWSKPERVEEAQYDGIKHFKILIETQPGDGQFYASSKVLPNGTINVMEDIDRTNKYGRQSYCIDEHKLRSLCYCKQQIYNYHNTSYVDLIQA